MKTTYDQVATNESITQTKTALEANGISVEVVNSGAAAKDAALKRITLGSEVLTVTSETTRLIGLSEYINESGKYVSVRQKFMALAGKPEKALELRRTGSAANTVVGSAHAVTQDGKIMIASATGSQMPAEVYGADQVILIIGTQKIVKDLSDGLQRINEYVVPLEDKRALKAYGGHTSFNKLLVINKERPDRIHIIFIKEKVGF